MKTYWGSGCIDPCILDLESQAVLASVLIGYNVGCTPELVWMIPGKFWTLLGLEI
jgi:hypothetical protein